MIEFTEVQTKESLGTVDIENGELVGPFNLQSMIDAWLRQDKTPEEFMGFYGGDGWSNGYILSQEVAGKPVEEVQVKKLATFAQNDEELSPVTVIEKLRDLVAADVKADPDRGQAGVEANLQMELYVELINEAESDEDVTDIIEDILEVMAIADYDGAEDIVGFLKGFLGEEKSEPADAEKTEAKKPPKAEAEEPGKTLRYKIPRPIKK